MHRDAVKERKAIQLHAVHTVSRTKRKEQVDAWL